MAKRKGTQAKIIEKYDKLVAEAFDKFKDKSWSQDLVPYLRGLQEAMEKELTDAGLIQDVIVEGIRKHK